MVQIDPECQTCFEVDPVSRCSRNPGSAAPTSIGAIHRTYMFRCPRAPRRPYPTYPTVYFAQRWNCFDFFCIATTLIGFMAGSGGGTSVLRILRLARVFRLVRKLKAGSQGDPGLSIQGDLRGPKEIQADLSMGIYPGESIHGDLSRGIYPWGSILADLSRGIYPGVQGKSTYREMYPRGSNAWSVCCTHRVRGSLQGKAHLASGRTDGCLGSRMTFAG